MRLGVFIVIAALAYDFENSHLLRCAGLSKSTMVEMCVTVILLTNFLEIKKT